MENKIHCKLLIDVLYKLVKIESIATLKYEQLHLSISDPTLLSYS